MSADGGAGSTGEDRPKGVGGPRASSRVPDAVAGDARPAGDRGVAGDLEQALAGPLDIGLGRRDQVTGRRVRCVILTHG